MITILILLCFSVTLSCGEPKSYAGSEVWRIETKTEAHVELLAWLEAEQRMDFWTEVRVGTVHMRVDPGQRETVGRLLDSAGVDRQIWIPDLGQRVEESSTWVSRDSSKSESGHSMDWTSYHPVEHIQEYMEFLNDTYDFVNLISIGQSYEGREMMVLQVCKGGCGNKPIVWIDGGIHAREWIAPATAAYIMKELVESDSDHSDLTQNFDWFILPMVNPDGYTYTISNDRLWRKTRSENPGQSSDCYGTDANRNWGFHWNEGGSSSDPCSEAYMGSEAFSEVENRNIRDFILEHKGKVKLYSSLHSFAELILLPWGYTTDHPDNFLDIQMVAFSAVLDLQMVHGTEYTVCSISGCMYIASGGTPDWALGVADIPFSWAMELRDHGQYGFLLPPELIIPTGEETWAFHATAAREVAKRLK